MLGVSILGAGFVWWRDRDDRARMACPDRPSAAAPFSDDPIDGLTTSLVAEASTPTALAIDPTSGRTFIAEKEGRLLTVAEDGTTAEVTSFEVGSKPEQGLLGLAVDDTRRLLHVSRTDTNWDSVVTAFPLSDDGSVDLDAGDELLRLEQPHQTHNGGDLEIGPDGLLYLALGDGGPLEDPDGRGQSTDDLFGSIVRIDPDGEMPTAPIAFGLRNPWRFSFDRITGDLWVGDVGEFCLEEISVMPAGTTGANFGWAAMEGSRRLPGHDEPSDHVGPVHEYANEAHTCAVTGGFVYRGAALPQLRGHYLYSDFCDGRVWAVELSGLEAVAVHDTGVDLDLVTAFAEGPDGEPYVVDFGGKVVRIVAE